MVFKNTHIKIALASVFAIAGLGFGASSWAVDASNNLGVSANVAANCTITTAPVAFGAYDPVSANASAALNGTGTVSVACTTGSAADITLGEGANGNTGSTAAAPLRRMKGTGTNFLSYDLYSDATRLNVWGNTVATGLAYTGTGTVSDITVYGTIPAGQNLPTGSYDDTVVATITF